MSKELKEAGFDHFVIADKSWINFVGVGINEGKTNGKLQRYNFDKMNPSLQAFMLEQMPLLINEDVIKTKNLKYYKFTGKKNGCIGT